MTVLSFNIFSGGTSLPFEDGFGFWRHQKSFGLKSEDYNWSSSWLSVVGRENGPSNPFLLVFTPLYNPWRLPWAGPTSKEWDAVHLQERVTKHLWLPSCSHCLPIYGSPPCLLSEGSPGPMTGKELMSSASSQRGPKVCWQPLQWAWSRPSPFRPWGSAAPAAPWLQPGRPCARGPA